MSDPPAFDEMVDGQGGVRPHWRPLLSALHGLGEGGLQERAHRLDRALAEEGVGAVLPGAAPDAQAWRCDPVPVLLTAAEFAAIEAGLAQRARLLSAVLEDLYGPQTLLADGMLPAPAIFASPGFLRPWRDGDGVGDGDGDGDRDGDGARRMPLHLYAADLVRGPDGAWCVLADRTGGPDGLGAARENRRLLARVLPEAFHALQVRHQRGFFDLWRDTLGRGADEAPYVALLTRGHAHPLWFDDVVLSRELSCTLVEGGDLTVRGGRLFLKMLQRLQPIDVLLRRVDSALLDPLELDAAREGVAGLLDTARHEGVTILNPPGAELAAAPVIGALLPQLARARFGETLSLNAVPRLWLGAPEAFRTLRDSPRDWLLRSASDPDGKVQVLARLSEAELEACLARVRQQPEHFVAIRDGAVGTAPVAGEMRLEAAPLALRVFLVGRDGHWQAMRGGLARMLDREAALGGDLVPGTVTKDVWVLAEDGADALDVGHMPVPPLRLQRSSGDLPSRVADNLFWLGRYVERLERAARLVRAACARVIQSGALSPRQQAGLRILVACLAEAGLVAPEAAGVPALTAALTETGRPRGALPALMGEIARLVEAVRDRLTDETYVTFVQALSQARLDIERAGRNLQSLVTATGTIRRFCTAVSGVAAENMVRGGGFLFLDLGRRLERAHAVTSEVVTALSIPVGQIEGGLALILELCDSAITYRTRYLNVLQPAPVLDLVLADQGNPRGLAFQLVAMHNHLDELNAGGFGREATAGAAAGLLAEAEALVGAVLAAPDQARAAAAQVPALTALVGGIGALSDRIVRRYFTLLPAAQSLGWGGETPLQGAA